MATAIRRLPQPLTRQLAPGVRLHVLRTRQFTTSLCRVVARRPLRADAAAAAVLAQVLSSATEAHPSRRALADALADRYGASLFAGVGTLGDAQQFGATLEWPTAFVGPTEAALIGGLELLREVWSRPLRDPDGLLAARMVEAERRNLVRALVARRSDKAAWTLRTLIAAVCRGEPAARDPRGTPAEAEAVTVGQVSRLHADLLRSAPVDIWLVGDVAPVRAERAVRRHLLWPGRAARPHRGPRVVGVHAAPARIRSRVLQDEVAQARMAFAWRAPLRPAGRPAAAAQTLAGVLGGGAYGRLFQVLRESEGLCYDASAYYDRAKGLLVVQIGVDPKDERAARRGIERLFGEVAGGQLDAQAHAAFLAEQVHRVETLPDLRGSLLGWYQQAEALGLPPDPREHLRLLRSVTAADVRQVGRRLAPAGRVVLRPRTGRA